MRLLLRTVRQYRRYENKIFSRIAWEYFLQRLFLTRPAGCNGGGNNSGNGIFRQFGTARRSAKCI